MTQGRRAAAGRAGHGIPHVRHHRQPGRAGQGRRVVRVDRQRGPTGTPRTRHGTSTRRTRPRTRVELDARPDRGRRRHHRPAAGLLHGAVPLAAAPERVLRHATASTSGSTTRCTPSRADTRRSTRTSPAGTSTAPRHSWRRWWRRRRPATSPSRWSTTTPRAELPKWSQNNGETYVMVGDPRHAILATTTRSARGTSTPHGAARDAARGVARHNNVRPGLNHLTPRATCPPTARTAAATSTARCPRSWSTTPADFALSAFAGALGDTANQTCTPNRAQDWQNTFNPPAASCSPSRPTVPGPAASARRAGELRRGHVVAVHRHGAVQHRGLATAIGGNAR